jgi:Sulfotransferase family
MSPAPKPNFFIVGAGKAGTTSLYHYLSQHPQIYMSPVKEPCYFAPEIRPERLNRVIRRHVLVQSKSLSSLLDDGQPVNSMGWLTSDWEQYLRLFAKARGVRAVGEASAAYLWSAGAAERIRAYRPDARIVMILRDPAERAFSQYLHQLSVGLTRASFPDHLRTCLAPGPRELGIYHPFLEIGLYARQVRRYLDCFPREQIRIYWYEEAWRRPEYLLTDVFAFLGVDPAGDLDTSQRMLERRSPRFTTLHYLIKRSGLWRGLRALVPRAWCAGFRRAAFRGGSALAMEPTERRLLVDYYRDDIRDLSALLNRDLSAWLR